MSLTDTFPASGDHQPASHESFVPCVVVGGGAVGLVTALLLVHHDVPVTVIAPRATSEPPQTEAGGIGGTGGDWRTVALFGESLALLDRIGAWDRIADHATPLAGIRMVDMSDAILRAPEVMFQATELGLSMFGANVAYTTLVAELTELALAHPQLTWISDTIVDAECDTANATLYTAGGHRLAAQTVIAADGRNSLLRTLSGLSARTWDYEQVAITALFAHTQPHDNISTELHFTSGPCTSVPADGNTSALVWMERPAVAKRLMRDGAAGFRAVLADRFADILGDILTISDARPVRLTGVLADQFASQRVFLVGETAHAFPPIGAQGLNLGLRDAAEAASQIVAAINDGKDPGEADTLNRYHSRRRADITARTYGVNALNASLTGSIPGLDVGRGLGLHVTRASTLLRRQLMARGMTGLGPRAALMPDGNAWLRAQAGATAGQQAMATTGGQLT